MRSTRAVRTGVGQERKVAVEALESRRLLSVSLPRDVNAVGVPGTTGNLTDVNGTLFFTTDDGVRGVELWKTDGTEAGTTLVKDVRPGSLGSTPANLLNLNGTLLFTAVDGSIGPEVWRSDGTAAGTVPISSFTVGVPGAPFGLTRVGQLAYFFVNAVVSTTGTSSVELWKSDGTQAGTVKVADVSGPANHAASSPVAVGGQLYFAFGSLASPGQLWASDGSAAGTRLVKSVPTGGGRSVSNLTPFNGRLYFAAGDLEAGQELWKTDGTAEGTVRVVDFFPGPENSIPNAFKVSGDKLFFAAGNLDVGYELVTCDTSDQISVVDITPGPTSTPQLQFAAFAPLNGKVYFNNLKTGSGIELWVSDGTSAGTFEVADIFPGTSSSGPINITAAEGKIYFYARNGTQVGLWVSDGTPGNATFLKQFTTAATGRPQAITVSGGKVFFTANDVSSGVEVWRTDGTPGGTTVVRDINPLNGSSHPRFIGTLGNFLYYFADDGINGDQVWKTDGTTAGTTMVKDLGFDILADFHDPRGHAAGNYLYFTTSINRNPPNFDQQLWRTDGTPEGTIELHQHARPLNSWASAGNIVYFTRDSFSEVWRTDGTTAGTFRAHTFEAPPFLGPSINGVAYLVGYTAANGREIWRSNPGFSVLSRVTDINPAAGDSYPQGLTAVGNELFFFALDGVTGGNKLYKTNGAPGNWTLVKDVVPNNDDYGGADGIGATASRLFFSAGDLWTSDGTPDGTYKVTDAAGTSPSFPSYIIPLSNTEVVFEGNSRLWKSDGTQAGTMQLANVDIEHSGTPWRTNMARVGNAVYLPAEATAGRPPGIWRTDGTAQGTYMVSNMTPGGTGYTGQLAAVNGGLMFTSENKVSGIELWRYAPDPPLLVTEAQFDHGGAAPAPHRLTFRLSAAAAARPEPAELSLMNLTTNTPVPAADFVRTYDAAARTVTFIFPTLPSGFLPNGNYRAVLPAGALTDTSGNALGVDHTFEFFVLQGDINRDRRTDGGDFALLASNFGKSGMTYAQGDLNGDGRVDGGDFALLASNFGKTVPAPAAQAVVLAPAAPVTASPPAPVAAAPGAAQVRRRVPTPRPAPRRQLSARPARGLTRR